MGPSSRAQRDKDVLDYLHGQVGPGKNCLKDYCHHQQQNQRPKQAMGGYSIDALANSSICQVWNNGRYVNNIADDSFDLRVTLDQGGFCRLPILILNWSTFLDMGLSDN